MASVVEFKVVVVGDEEDVDAPPCAGSVVLMVVVLAGGGPEITLLWKFQLNDEAMEERELTCKLILRLYTSAINERRTYF